MIGIVVVAYGDVFASSASKKPGEPLIISDIKKASMAHRYLLYSIRLWLLYYLYSVCLSVSVSLFHSSSVSIKSINGAFSAGTIKCALPKLFKNPTKVSNNIGKCKMCLYRSPPPSLSSSNPTPLLLTHSISPMPLPPFLTLCPIKLNWLQWVLLAGYVLQKLVLLYKPVSPCRTSTVSGVPCEGPVYKYYIV